MSIGEICISGSSTDKTALHAWDIRSGTILTSLRSSTASCTSMASLAFPSSLQSAILFVAQVDAPLILLYSWNKEQSIGKYIIPEKLHALESSPDGVYLVGGGLSGRIYIWNIGTGLLLKMFDAHLGKVIDIKFNCDASLFFSSGEDSMIQAWKLQELLDFNFLSATPKPYKTLASHRLPVTSIHCSYGMMNDTRLYSSSLDRTAKIWELSSGECLCTIVFPHQITCMVVDPAETFMIVGTDTGKIYNVDLDGTFENKATSIYERMDHQMTVDAVSTGHESKSVMSGHLKKVNSLSLSFDSTLLVSGSDDETAIVWDIQSRQAVRSFTYHKGPVTLVSIMIKPFHLGDVDFLKARLPDVSPLQRYQTTEASSFVQSSNTSVTLPSCFEDTPEHVRIDKLQAEVETLRKDNAKLQGFNDEMYQATVSSYLNSKQV